jgi:hypothetical protein
MARITRSSFGTQTATESKTIASWIKESVKEQKVALMMMAVEFCSLVTFLPAAVVYIAIEYFECRVCETSVILSNLSPWASYANSAINPFILLIMNDDFRNGITRRRR